MNGGDTANSPIDNVGYGSDIDVDESDGLLPSSQRSDNTNDGKLLKYCTY